MLNKIIEFSVKNKLIIGLFVIALIVFGIYQTTKLPIDAVPDITNVQVQINTEAPGYSPFEVEQRVTIPIELLISGLPSLDYTRSLSRYGLSQLTVVFKDGTNIYSKTLVLDGGMPIGFRASIGTLYKLNEKLSLFGEINLVSLEYAPNKGSITDSTKNGTSNLSTLTVKDKEIEFVDNFVDTSAPSNPNVSSKYPIIAFSFSSIGLNLGLQYQF